MRQLRKVSTAARRLLGRGRHFATVRRLEQGLVRQLPSLVRVHRRTLSRHARVVAVTGTQGKTSTTRALTAVLGGPEHHLNQNTTKGICWRILKTLPWHRHVVVEASVTKPGEMRARAELISPDVVIVTSIGSDHSDLYPTLEATREEKVELVRALPSSGLALLNGDDPNVRWMAEQTRARVLTYGFGAANDLRAEEPVMRWPDGMEFEAHARSGSVRVETRLLGRVMVYPMLAAIAVGEHAGLRLESIVRSLARVTPAPIRLEPVALPNGAYLLRDFTKASIETVNSAFDTFEQIPARRLMVLGDLDYIADPEAVEPTYREVARRALEIADTTCFLADNYAAYQPALSASGAHLRCEDVFEVIDWLKQELRKGDVVLLKGRKWQKLDRITIGLRGETVRCGVTHCMAKLLCASCPFLARLPHEVSRSEIAALSAWGIEGAPHLTPGNDA